MKDGLADNKMVSTSKSGGKVKQQIYPVFSTVVGGGGLGSGTGKNPKLVLGQEPHYPGLMGKKMS